MLEAKKPIAVVLVQAIQVTMEAILGEHSESNTIRLSMWMGMLIAQLEMLKQMVIPEPERQWVLNSLRRIKDKYPAEKADKLLPEQVFWEISADY